MGSDKKAVLLDVSSSILLDYASEDGSERIEVDAGPAVLASLVSTAEPDPVAASHLAQRTWLRRYSSTMSHAGMYGGLSGLLAGLSALAPSHPEYCNLARAARDALSSEDSTRWWRTDPLSWADYDLVSGASGVVLVTGAGSSCEPEPPALRHLRTLTIDHELGSLRLTDKAGDARRRWNLGLVNTGMAHGAAGVTSALTSAARTSPHVEVLDALRTVSAWLVRSATRSARGVVTWPPGSFGRPTVQHYDDRRQAWCYGTPGISWSLWDASMALGDLEMRRFAEDAMTSYCRAFEPKIYLDDSSCSAELGVCHGAAGIYAIADAFSRHAELASADRLRAVLEDYLMARLLDVQVLSQTNLSLLTGAGGILSVMLAAQDLDRAWLRQIALR